MGVVTEFGTTDPHANELKPFDLGAERAAVLFPVLEPGDALLHRRGQDRKRQVDIMSTKVRLW